jgi:carboxyl-terminal processing protease
MRRLAFATCLAAVLATSISVRPDEPKDMTPAQRNYVNVMLTLISEDVVKHYYDPTLHGVDWQARVSHVRDQIKEEKSMNMAMSHIAAVLDSLNDSHTFLIPPPRSYFLDHGWTLQMVGNSCYVTRVRPGGDAEKHGVKPGDQVISINGFRVSRGNLWKIEYTFNTLRPLPQLTLALRSPQGEERKAMLEATLQKHQSLQDLENLDTFQTMELSDEEWVKRQRVQMQSYGDDLLIAKLRSFMFDEGEANRLISNARKHKTLILDLRENPGGDVEMLKLMVGGLFDHEVKLYDRAGRESHKPMIAKPNHHNYDGKVIVLIDSKSASAAELLARVVQLEKRGTVMGDVSSGSVMEAKHYTHTAGTDIVTFFGASITDANLIMTDGKSLEHTGVTPDEMSMPTAQDVAGSRDPVLSHAAEIAGVKLSPEDAGKLFPYEWPKYDAF